MSTGNDKLYIMIILAMVGCFIYWYQTRLDSVECPSCQYKRIKCDNIDSLSRSSYKAPTKSYAKTSDKILNRTSAKISAKTSNKIPTKTLPKELSNKEKIKSKSHHKKKKHKRLQEDDTEKINDEDNDNESSLESLDSSDHASLIVHKSKHDTDTDDSLDI